MPEVVDVPTTENHLLRLHDLEQVADRLSKGRVAVLPTDTGYMLAVDALQEAAVERIFELKGRPADNPMHVAVASVAMARSLVVTGPDSERVMDRLLPGPITVICPKREHVPDRLVAGTGNLGIRIPDSPVPVLLSAVLGAPLTATSLNLSGASPWGDLDELIASLHWEDGEVVHVVRDPSLRMRQQSSTVVTFATRPWRILREGPVPAATIEHAVAGTLPDGVDGRS